MNFSVSYMLQRLGFSGTDAIVVLAERSFVTELRCAMPICYCPGGRGFFEKIGSRTPDDFWTPSQDHHPVLKENGGHLVPENVRLAHKRCNGFDYGRSESHEARRAVASKRRIDELSAFKGAVARWSEARRKDYPENAPDFNVDPASRLGYPSPGPIRWAGDDQENVSDRDPLPEADWRELLAERLPDEYWDSLREWLEQDASSFYPPRADVFRALELTWLRETKVVVVGQDPYPKQGQADGLCFSVRPGVSIPPSLYNIRKRLSTDQPDATIPEHGSLEAWARKGVLLLNTALTVDPGRIGSHLARWKRFTDEVIKVTSDTKANRVVFMLWGCDAQKKAKLIDEYRHTIIPSSHPAPLAASRPCRGSPPFLVSRPFSEANQILIDSGQEPIDWSLTADSS